MLSAPALAERGRSQIASVSQTNQHERGLEEDESAAKASDPANFVFHTRTTSEILPGGLDAARPGGHDAEIRPGGHDRGAALVATVCAGRTASKIGHSSPHDPSRHPDGGRLVGYRSAVRQAAIVAMTQPATIVTAYVTHQTHMASMTNSSRYVR